MNQVAARFAVLLCAALGVLGSCGVQETPTETPGLATEGNLSADEVLSRARAAGAAVTSYRYTWDLNRRDEKPDEEPSVIELHEEGRWRAPSDFFADTVLPGRHYQEISVDEVAYIRYLPGDGWHEHGPSQYRGAPDVPGMAAEWEIADPNAMLDGQPAYYLTGAQGLTDEVQTFQAEFEVYVRRADFLPLSVGTRTESQFTEEPGSERHVLQHTTRYYDFNEPVTIEAPSDATPVPVPNSRSGY